MPRNESVRIGDIHTHSPGDCANDICALATVAALACQDFSGRGGIALGLKTHRILAMCIEFNKKMRDEMTPDLLEAWKGIDCFDRSEVDWDTVAKCLKKCGFSDEQHV